MDEALAESETIAPGTIVEEIRFAVVMYGGISLCVYMNGIMQQMLHLVRSTARQAADASEGEFLVPENEAMPPIERAYRRLARVRSKADKVACRFIVDILSGTSAGGLNNLFLSRALANEEPVSALTELWIREGDIGGLFNDANSEDPQWGIVAERPPESLLNSRRMAQRLLEAMRTMERQGDEARTRAGEDPKAKRASRLVRRLDLYMTATDLQGLDLSLRIASDESITEKRHRAFFHFVHDPANVGYFADQKAFRNDFDPRMTPFLTFVSRATSSIVPAFEPVRLDDMEGLQDPGPRYAWYSRRESPLQYSPFFNDFWRNAEVLQIEDAATRDDEMARRKKTFAYRPFGDGGYGDNYPFGYAIDEVARRQSEYRVDRKFLYIEPDPDLPAPSPPAPDGVPARPNVVAHLSAMQGVKSTETIREDIARLRDQNRLLDRLGSVRLAAEQGDAPPPASAYLRLRASATTDELATVFQNAFGFEADTPYQDAIRAIVKAIRERVFERPPGDGKRSGDLPTGTEGFLRTFDLATLRRWTKYEQRVRVSKGAASGHADELEALTAVGNELRRVPVLLEVAAARNEPIESAPEVGASRADERITTAPNAARSEALMGYFSERRQRLMPDERPAEDVEGAVDEFLVALADLGPRREDGKGYHISLVALARLVIDHPVHWTGISNPGDPAPDQERIDAAWRLLTGVAPQGPGETAAAFSARAASESEDGRPRVEAVVLALGRIYRPTIARAEDRLLKISRDRQRFEANDRAMFPVLYGAGETESGRIDILRVSPLDCRSLTDDPKAAKSKLAGTGLGHFSGFFKDVWRAQDILWGRLDGAERLVCAVLEDDSFARRSLILQAQLAILSQDDLDAVIARLEAEKPRMEALPPESTVLELRRTLLVRALDRFAIWASNAMEKDKEGRMVKVYDGHGLSELFGPKDEGGALTFAERQKLLQKGWEGLE